MRRIRRLLPLVPAAFSALLLAACRDKPGAAAVTPPVTPPSLAVPADQKLLLGALAKGDQVYTCSAKAGGAFEWVLKAPQAELFDERGQVIGKHYGGPTWESIDGSKVVGQVKEKADAPDPGAIQWLLVEAKSNAGQGIFAKVKSVQRVDTWGGKAPKEGCDASHAVAESKVGYRARYYFYQAAGG
jgi:hypothetical protein